MAEKANSVANWTVEKVVKPSRDVYIDSCKRYPLATIFGTVLLAFSIVPLFAFIGFTLSFVGALAVTAILVITFLSCIFVGGASLLLFGALGFALLAASIITSIILFNLALWKLSSQVLDVGIVQGTKNFAEEIRTYFVGKQQGAAVKINGASVKSENND